MISRRVGMYPSPFLNDRWHQEGNPHLRFIAESIAEHGWEVVPVELDELLEPACLSAKNLSLLHLHWPDAILIFLTRLKPLSFLSRPGPVAPLLQRLEVMVNNRWSLPPVWLAREPMGWIRQWIQRLAAEKIPLIWEIHDLISHSMGGSNLFGEVARFLYQSIYDLAQAIVLHELSCRSAVFDFYGQEKPFAIAQLGDYSIVYGPRRSPAEARASLGINSSGRVLAYVGTARKNRNPAVAMREFPKAAGPQDRLIVAGQRVSRYIGANYDARILVFDGVLPGEKIRDIFCASDFIINDARNYLTSAVVRAAISYSVPVIAYPYGSTLDMAREAAIFISEAEEGLATAINMALKVDRGTYQRMMEAASQRNLERHWSQTGAACTELYQQVLAGC